MKIHITKIEDARIGDFIYSNHFKFKSKIIDIEIKENHLTKFVFENLEYYYKKRANYLDSKLKSMDVYIEDLIMEEFTIYRDTSDIKINLQSMSNLYKINRMGRSI